MWEATPRIKSIKSMYSYIKASLEVGINYFELQ